MGVESVELSERPYYLFHTLFGKHDRTHHRVLSLHGRNCDEIFKIDSFLNAPNPPEGIAFSLGLNIREVICTISQLSPAVTYHRPYGLILHGEIRVSYDNDSGLLLQENGEYKGEPFSFVNETTPDELLGKWCEEYKAKKHFTWNEAILRKGSQVRGIFHGPNFNPEKMLFDESPHKTKESDFSVS